MIVNVTSLISFSPFVLSAIIIWQLRFRIHNFLILCIAFYLYEDNLMLVDCPIDRTSCCAYNVSRNEWRNQLRAFMFSI